ncbi:unnamed protein product [Hyaloperonospora brassicae]|uniref:Calcineurin-like phosphoesterase domain-containing protein n=1 Tax=Hyaloperonospora brassicae TaxID=162125 RepID=A0AAV0U7P9_HYABA|nr:unnamed protein product [Hyaloperonospora brassicae]
MRVRRVAWCFALRKGASFVAVVALGLGLASPASTAASVSFDTAAKSTKLAVAALHDIGSTVGDGLSAAKTSDGANVRHILHFSDVHLNISKSHSERESAEIPVAYGNDAPMRLLVSALAYAKTVLPDPDLFLYTGDHVVRGELTDEYLAEVIEKNVKTMAEYYNVSDSGKMTGITAVVGNADTNPSYNMTITDPAIEENPEIASIAGAWQDSLSQTNLEWLKRRGYLAYTLGDNLTVLTLNTVPYSPDHVPDTSSVLDPFEQFAWLNASLAGLRSAGKYAYIVGHIPPVVDSFGGSPMWNETYIRTYKNIVCQYSDIIKTQLFGHVHSVEFRLPLARGLDSLLHRDGVLVADEEKDSSDLVPLFMVAAISPIFSSNPAFMVWDYDHTTYDLLDFTVHGGNISSLDGTVDWQPLFKASQEYGVSTLRASEIARFAARTATDARLLERYYFNSKAQSHLQPSCLDVSCQAKWQCSLYWWSTVRVVVTTAFVLLTSTMRRRGGVQESSKLLQRQRVIVASMA